MVRLDVDQGDGSPDTLSSDDYSLVWKHRRLFEQCRRETPRLLRLLKIALAESAVDAHRPPGQALKEALRSAGVPEAGRRMMCNTPTRALDGALAVGRGAPDFRVVLGYLRLLCEIGICKPPPSRLAALLAGMVVDVDREPFLFDEYMPEYWSSGSVRNAFSAGREADREGRLKAFIKHEYLPDLQWARDISALRKAPTPRSWSKCVRCAREWEAQGVLQASSRARDWPFGRFPAKLMDLTPVPLHNEYDLLAEALVLRHCAHHMASKCEEDGMRLFSLRDDRGRRVATVALVRHESGFVLDQVKGFANAEVGAGTRQAAELLAACYDDGNDDAGSQLANSGEAGLAAASVAIFREVPTSAPNFQAGW